MKSRLKFTLSLLILLTAPYLQAGALATYQAEFEQSVWTASGDVFGCTLQQPIPRFGMAVFQHQAGEQPTFYLQSADNPLQEGRGLLVSVPPQWRHGIQERDLGYVDVQKGSRPVQMDNRQSRVVLVELERGMVPTLVRRAWYDEDQAVRVGLSPVNFTAAFSNFRECTASLLPVNFGQIERSTVFWQPNQRELSADNRRQLDDIVAYAKADPGIFSFEINGFTDGSGASRDNLELSRIRAFAVHNYLVANGIDEAQLATRFFGSTEEYRIVRNERSAADRDRNRRVTILIRRR